jgi:ACR3 family arsenite transporter
MSTFERYLTAWVALRIVAGFALGHFFPGFFHAAGSAEIAKVNLSKEQVAATPPIRLGMVR